MRLAKHRGLRHAKDSAQFPASSPSTNGCMKIKSNVYPLESALEDDKGTSGITWVDLIISGILLGYCSNRQTYISATWAHDEGFCPITLQATCVGAVSFWRSKNMIIYDCCILLSISCQARNPCPPPNEKSSNIDGCSIARLQALCMGVGASRPCFAQAPLARLQGFPHGRRCHVYV